MNINQRVRVVYTNWRGETAARTIIPQEIVFTSNEYHQEPQWLLRVYDCDREAERYYAMSEIKEWHVSKEPT